MKYENMKPSVSEFNKLGVAGVFKFTLTTVTYLVTSLLGELLEISL